MDLQKLRGFYWTAHFGSVSAAAQRIHVSQSAVSHQLRSLEAELGAKLYERTHSGVVLTPEGELLLKYARTVVQTVEDLKETFDEVRGQPRGEVRLAAYRGIAVYSLPDIVQRFHALYPDIPVVVSSKNFDTEILRLVASGEVDLGITSSWNEFEGLDYLEVASFDMFLCMAASHPWRNRQQALTIPDLAAQRLLLYEKGTAIRDRIDRIFTRHGVEPDVSVEAGGSHAVLEYVKRGLGVGIVSGLVLRDRGDPALHAIPVSDLFGTLGYGFVLRSGRTLRTAIRAFLEVADVAPDRRSSFIPP